MNKYIKLFEDYINVNYEFAYTCVSPSSDKELEAIIDELDESEVSIEYFLKVIPFNEVNEYLPVVYKNEQQLLDDYHVKCYIGSFYFDDDGEFNREMAEDDGEEYDITLDGTLIEYAVMVHSAIEHVWKK